MLLTDFEYLNTSEIAFKKKVALQIKRLRRQNQVSQEKFYTETNINIARLESGKVDIRLDTLMTLYNMPVHMGMRLRFVCVFVLFWAIVS